MGCSVLVECIGLSIFYLAQYFIDFLIFSDSVFNCLLIRNEHISQVIWDTVHLAPPGVFSIGGIGMEHIVRRITSSKC